jgi:hypothetical protein
MVAVSAILRAFDRKERAWVVRNVIGNMAPPIAPEFLKKLETELDLSPPLGTDAWWGVDYHLDWLAAAIHAFRFHTQPPDVIEKPQINAEALLKHGIEDIDLIIADGSRLILIEAKAFGHWDKSQLDSKVKRLRQLFQDTNTVSDSTGTSSIQVFFVLMSMRRRPRPSVYAEWPSWMLPKTLPSCGKAPAWIPLATSHEKTVKRPLQCNEIGKADGEGTYWRILTEPVAAETS